RRLLHRDQPLLDHLVEGGQEGLDLLLRVHDLDDDGQVLAEAEDARGVDSASGPESLEATEDRGPREAAAARARHDNLVERAPVPAVGLADEDADELAVARELQSRILASTAPAQTATRPRTTWPTTFTAAMSPLPSRRRAMVS